MSNATAEFSTPAPVAPAVSGEMSTTILIVVLLGVGACGNLLTLFILNRIRSSGDRRHKFLLQCLAVNDFLALIGMLVMTVVKIKWPWTASSMWMCRFVVLCRFFGLGSGCATAVMAIERWLAVTRPSFYQRHISQCTLKRVTFSLWLGLLCLVCAPLFGFGIYWDNKSKKCIRIRDAINPLDVTYAYLFFSFGVFLCIVITYTNLTVMKTLCMSDSRFIAQVNLNNANGSTNRILARTKEERSFGWLMFFLCVSFVTCWLPQLASIPLTMYIGSGKLLKLFYKAADILLVLHFLLNPYLYVLQRWEMVKPVLLRWKSGKRNARNNNSSIISNDSYTRTSYDITMQPFADD